MNIRDRNNTYIHVGDLVRIKYEMKSSSTWMEWGYTIGIIKGFELEDNWWKEHEHLNPPLLTLQIIENGTGKIHNVWDLNNIEVIS